MEVVAKRRGVLPAPLESLKIGKTLGRGGFAVVKSGVLKTADGAPFAVAVKVLHPEYSDETSQELRLFRDEAQLMLQLEHRNIIIAYGLLKLSPQFPGLDGHTQPAYALVLEMMEGGSLASLMVKQLLSGTVQKYSFSQALGWLIDVARALQHLHTGGKDGSPRIHRDVKLENVLLTGGLRTAKLADFGLQRAIFSQEGDDQTILVRRSQRPSALTQPARSGPAGPSRLAPEFERPSSRQQAVPQRASQRASRSTDNLLAMQLRASSGEQQQQEDTLFYTVGCNGLTPLVLPNSPTPARDPLQSQSGAPERRRDVDIARRSASMSRLDTREEEGEVRLAVSGSPCQRLPMEQQRQAAMMPGQLTSAGNNLGALRKALGAIAPPAPPAIRLPGASPSASRPSPLGPTSSRMRRSIGDISPLGGGSFASGEGVSPKGPSLGAAGSSRKFGAANSSLADSPPRAERVGSGSERPRIRESCGSPNPVAERAAASPGPLTSDAHCSILSSDWQSSRALTATAGAAPPLSASASGGLDGMGQSTASARDVILADMTLQPPDGHRASLPQAGGVVPASPRAFQVTSMRRIGATAPGAFGSGGAAGKAVSAASNSRCRLQLLALADVDNGDAEDCLSPGSGATRRTPGSVSRKLPPGCNKRPESVDCTAKVQFVVVQPALLGGAPHAATESGMSSAAEKKNIVDAPAFADGSNEKVSSQMPTGEPNSGARNVPACRLHSLTSGNVDIDRAAGGSSPASAPLQLVDLLHLRLGAQNVSVRSVRSSANGATLRNMASAPSSPRMAAVAAATRAAAARAGWREDVAGGGGAATGATRGGSLPGGLDIRPSSGRAKAPVADFEEVFSLTGRTGSLMYLAPEAYRNEPYNDKVDVYSLAILMYELFGRTSITYTHISTKLPAFSRMLCNPDEFAERVAAGYRPPRTNQMTKMPPQLWELIEMAWHQDPVERPDIDTVLAALEDLVGPLAECEADKGRGQLASPGCGCIIS